MTVTFVFMGVVVPILVCLGAVIYLLQSMTHPEADAGPLVQKWRSSSLHASLKHHSPLLIGLVWILYGFAHLLSPESAAAQMPEIGNSDWVAFLFAASGALEILLGVLGISWKWRKPALLGQLIFLVALAPFVVFLLFDNDALNSLFGTETALPFHRLMLVLHNVLLFVWIHWAYAKEEWRPPTKELIAAIWPGATQKQEREPSTRSGAVLITATVLLLVNIAGFSVIFVSDWDLTTPSIWALASLSVGGLVGFIFGVPKWAGVRRAGGRRARYEPNTNIEQLSDWLTKIVVGVGLVELHNIEPLLDRLSEGMAGGLVPKPGAESAALAVGPEAFATAVIVYFVVAGLIQGFLLTRMFLTQAWQPER